MAIACKYCIRSKGLKGSELSELFQTEEEFLRHLEREHHIPIKRDDETEAQCQARFRRENPEAGGPNCRCPECQDRRRRGLKL
jgi:hypothetical protein